MRRNCFKIVIPVYNSEKWIEKCLQSVLDQNKDLIVEVGIINDASTDKTLEVTKSFLERSKYPYHIRLFDRGKNVGALENIVYGISQICQNDEDIIVLLDGDDWLYSKNVLSYINEVYENNPSLWLTYGQFVKLSNDKLGLNDVITDTRIYRKSNMWVTSHLRTFKYHLWKRIVDKDLRDDKNQYFRMSWDMAIMYPMIEMAGKDRIQCIRKNLYVYNDLNPINDFKKDQELQIRTAEYIRRKLIYKVIG